MKKGKMLLCSSYPLSFPAGKAGPTICIVGGQCVCVCGRTLSSFLIENYSRNPALAVTRPRAQALLRGN